MKRTQLRKTLKLTTSPTNFTALLKADSPAKADPEVHVFGKGFRCDTEARGHATPQGRSPLEIVVDASEGFIPLWTRETTLRWRFRESTMKYFKSPATAKAEIRKLLGEALLAWGDAAPIKFAERSDVADFEIVMKRNDDCEGGGCVLASAFFPDSGRHQLTLYPILFKQPREEQVETICHEIGHIFGLRHFFANVSETAFPSEIFGAHEPFSIMNYGGQSTLTSDDKSDLKRLYQLVWAGQMTQINGTPIKLVQAYHTIGTAPDSVVSVSQTQPAARPVPRAAAYVGGI